MTPTTEDPEQIPPPPPFAAQLPEEVDVDLDEHDQGEGEQVLTPNTIPEGVSHLGSYPTLERYLRAQLEEEVSDPCQWILDCLDWSKVQKRFEADGSRLVCESGEVYRMEARR